MGELKIGIVGIGNMGSFHAESLYAGKIVGAKLDAVMDIDERRLVWAEKFDGVKRYRDFDLFIQDQEIDAVIIATPHYDHPTLGLEVIKNKKHLLIEKPAGVFTKNVRLLNEEAKTSGLVFSIMFNQRTNPVYQQIKELMDTNQLGELRRVNWIVTNWYRSTTYYESGGWRATWEKEGGGVLLNQAPHQLDLLCWMFGMPKKVLSHMTFGAHRNIAVENDVTTLMTYPNGATGVFITSTFDAPGTNRLEVVGSRGRLLAENGKLTFDRLLMDESIFDQEHHENLFAVPPHERITYEVKENPWGIQHNIILQNFINHILHKEPLVSPGVEGIMGLTLSNAMHLSAFTHQEITLEDMDEDLFIQELEKRIRMEKHHEKA
jgi:predicted dehydrogenase